MANYNAHTYFGMRVLEQLPSNVRRLCADDMPAFRLGLYGPDPLIFSLLTKKISDHLHQHWKTESLPELRRALQSDDPTARSFAAGYLLHQLLDDIVHPRIYRWMKMGSSHFRVELALDHLVLRDTKCLNSPKLITYGKERTAQAAASMLLPVHEWQYRSGLWRMAQLSEYVRYQVDAEAEHMKELELIRARTLRDYMEEGVAAAANELAASFCIPLNEAEEHQHFELLRNKKVLVKQRKLELAHNNLG